MLAARDYAHAADALRQHLRARPGTPALTEFLGHTDAAWVGLVHARQEQLARRAEHSFEVLRRVEEVLVLSADAMGQVDRWAAEIEDKALAVGARAHAELVEMVRSLGEELDRRCAEEIFALSELLCATESAGGLGLGDMVGVSARDVDALQRARAADALLPPEVVGALGDDVQVLEISSGRAALALGDIDSAPAIITLVGGVGSSEVSQWAGQVARARELHRATGAAVVAWMGYDAPPTVAGGIASAPARVGGQELVRFQRALRARGGARLVVVGHSYGSVVAGHAALEEPGFADAVMVVGSPGLPPGAPAPAAAGLGTVDPIAAVSSLHGVDPAAVADVVVRPPVGHSEYFSDPSVQQVVRDILQGPTAT